MELPALITGREDHGCGHYINNDDKMVLLQVIIYYLINYLHIQVYLVTGGYDGSGKGLSSTEVLVEGTTAWMSAGELPMAMGALKAVSLNNKIFITGNIITE